MKIQVALVGLLMAVPMVAADGSNEINVAGGRMGCRTVVAEPGIQLVPVLAKQGFFGVWNAPNHWDLDGDVTYYLGYSMGYGCPTLELMLACTEAFLKEVEGNPGEAVRGFIECVESSLP